jgi:uncharacterized protein YdiU (UPF0061 family)
MNKPSDADLSLDLGLNWRNRFAALGADFSTRLRPAGLRAPYWVGRSRAAAQALGLAEHWLESEAALQAFTGNLPLAGSEPLASVYSGHQFGVWAGQLGDGRALLLGEVAATGERGHEIQLKGSGLTPYSRMGDGRAVLRSSIREFLGSEAMHGLGIPTTRALCVTGSDDPVRRETIETAAVVTRTAPSFIRFGHFEHFSYNGQHEPLQRLADFVIDGFYPECRDRANPYAALLAAVARRTASLIAQWQGVGFCHGVMNTDNMSILGLTIDYGPREHLQPQRYPGPLRLEPPAQRRLLEPVLPGSGPAAADRRARRSHRCTGALQAAVRRRAAGHVLGQARPGGCARRRPAADREHPRPAVGPHGRLHDLLAPPVRLRARCAQ